MKIFAVYANVTLTKKPEWLDGFREKYDERYDFHITLKQPCFINEAEIDRLKESVETFFRELKVPNGKIDLVFNAMKIDKDKKGHTIMLNAKPSGPLIATQRNLRSLLADYTSYVDTRTEDFEKKFVPHITIARHLGDDQFREAMQYMKSDTTCAGEIKEFVLSIVNEISAKEAKNPLNKTIYKL
jgi:2'-5' RNA ligase